MDHRSAGWKKYYLDPSIGIMCHGWKLIGNVWYYFGEKQYSNASHPYGAMYVNEKTPDGYYVGSNGGWIQNYSENDSDDPDPAPKSYTVTFNMQGHGTQIAPIKNVLSGAKITAPTAPTAEGYEFVCWCKEPECATPWNFDIDTVTKDTTIYANWRQNPAPVTVADILPGDFPTTEAAAWKNPENVKCYRTQSATLFFKTTYYEQVQLSQPVTAVGSNWETGIGQGGKITFEMENSKLISIVVSRLAGDFRKINGSYVAPEPVVHVTGVSLNETTITLSVDGNQKLTAAVVPDNATDKAVTWSSSNESVAKVNNNGTVTAIAAGTAIITVTTVDGGKTNTCTVTVTAPSPTEYTITYDANGATSGTAPAAQTKIQDEDLTLAANTGNLANSVYRFAGWNTASDGTGTHYDAGATYKENAELTLYAEWAEHKTIAEVLSTVDGGFPFSDDQTKPSDNAWVADVKDKKKCYAYTVKSGSSTALLLRIPAEGEVRGDFTYLLTTTEVTTGENYYTAPYPYGTVTFNRKDGILTGFTCTHKEGKLEKFDGTYAAPKEKELLKSSGTSSDPVNDAPMAETEVSEPAAEVFEPEFEPEKFEEAKPEELIEPAEAVAEEAAP